MENYNSPEQGNYVLNDAEENYLSGYIKLYRSLRNHWIWKDANKLKWWLDILLDVNHKDQKVSLGYELFDCKRGSSLNSLETWSKRWGVDKSTVRRFLKLLEDDKMIVTRNVQKTTHLTVCKYASYNDERHAKQTQSKREATLTQTRHNANNNDKNDNNVKNREERAQKFYDELKGHVTTYPKEMLRAFYNYWTELNKSGAKMRFELEQTWETEKRLTTWASREKVVATPKAEKTLTREEQIAIASKISSKYD